MSFADNLKDSAKSAFDKTSERVRESDAYIQLQDRYQNLSPSGQKLARAAGILLILFVFLFVPLSYLSSSSQSITLFESKRELIRDLFRTYRESSSTQNVTLPPAPDSLRAQIQAVIQRAELTPEQNIGVAESSMDGRLIPQNLISSVLDIKLMKLNLKQIVDIGSAIVAINDSVKMKDVTIIANTTDNRYYDVTYKLYSLKVPEPIPEPVAELEPIKKGANSRGGNRDSGKKTDSETSAGSDE
jgi:hypothetical protein